MKRWRSAIATLLAATLLITFANAARGQSPRGNLQVQGFPAWNEVANQPSFGTGSFPRGVDVDPETGTIYVALRNRFEIVRRDAGGADLGKIAGGLVTFPEGIEIVDGEIYIAEEGDFSLPPGNGDVISVWGLDGTFKRRWGGTGSAAGQLREPCDVAVRGTEVFVLDALNHRIQVFTTGGTFLRQWGGQGGSNGKFVFNCAHSAIEAWGDEIFVTDSGNNRVQVFDPNGSFLRKWGATGNDSGEFNNPAGLDIAKSMVYVADSKNGRVQVFTTGGNFQGVIDANTPWEPVGVKVDRTGNVLWVTENGHTLRTFTTFVCEGKVPTHVGSSYDDDFTTGALADVVHGGGGDDTIVTGAGDDTACGGEGDDMITTLAGKDRVRGQNGDDVIRGGTGNDNLNGNNGADQVFGEEDHDYVSGRDGQDVVDGGPGTDTVNGGGKRDIIRGGSGNDTMNGNAGPDEVWGQAGNDTLKGGDGADEIIGDTGNDVIEGGNGIDTIRGGVGFDTCDGKAGVDPPATGCEIVRNIP